MKLLRQALGNSYGGPSVSHEGGRFILYVWSDAPVRMDILRTEDGREVAHKDWEEFLNLVEAYQSGS